ncbi:MAG: hypothetical protein LJE65_11020 [Desulfobacteraceae bacterium]|nr:hypothetical protein [Desulfobacteraceae bacterium]
MGKTSYRIFFLSLFLVTGTALSFEILLMRLFSLVHGHHFASMIVSLALLGLGTAGVVLQIFQNRLLPHRDRLYPAVAFLFGLSIVGSFVLAQAIPFNPREMTWSALPWLALSAHYLIYAFPFFFSGMFVALAMSDPRFSTGRLYRADLLGSAAGAACLLMVLFRVPAHRCLAPLGFLALTAAVLATRALPSRAPAWLCAGIVSIGAAFWLLPASLLHPGLSQYKDLAVLRLIPGTETVMEKTTPAAYLELVRVPGSPLRRAPGLAADCAHEPPPQLGVFTDGNLYGTLPLPETAEHPFAYLSCLPVSAVFEQTQRSKVLIKDVFASPELLLGAREHGAVDITGTTMVVALPEALRKALDEPAMGFYFGAPVRYARGMARVVVARTEERYDVIGFWLRGSTGQPVGATSITEQFDLTVEGLRALISHLSDKGVLAVSMWRRHPPYETLKFLATLQAAMHGGAAERVVILGTPSTLTVMAGKSPWAVPEKRRLQQFAASRMFDFVTASPGAPIPSALGEDVRRIFGPDAESFRSNYKFHIQPATDDRPFFHRFFTWRSAGELLDKRTRGGAALVQWDYLARVAALGFAALFGAALLILPVALRRTGTDELPPKRRSILYFGALGLGFLFVELTFIHLFTLFLGHPLLSAGTVVASFLGWAGVGSGRGHRYDLSRVLLVIVIILTLFAAGLGRLLDVLLCLPLPVRTAVAALLCGPPAFFMGMPFPKAMTGLRGTHPKGIPWAWGINGFASVVSPLLAVLLAMHIGFTAVLLLAALCYLTAWWQRPESVGSDISGR